MLRFSRRPCPPCGSDTLHKGVCCIHCGANNSPPRRPESSVKTYMRKGDFIGASLIIGRRKQAQKWAGKPADERVWLGDDSGSRDSTFGKGRTRTRV